MPENELSQQIGQLVGRIDRALDLLDRERFWRKVAAVLVILGFVSTIGFVSYLRQADCDRTNEARSRLPQAVAAGIGTGYDRYGPGDHAERASLTSEVERDVAVLYPPRDCRWPA